MHEKTKPNKTKLTLVQLPLMISGFEKTSETGLEPSGFGTCVKQPAIICQEYTIADDVLLQTEDYFFGHRSTMIR